PPPLEGGGHPGGRRPMSMADDARFPHVRVPKFLLDRKRYPDMTASCLATYVAARSFAYHGKTNEKFAKAWPGLRAIAMHSFRGGSGLATRGGNYGGQPLDYVGGARPAGVVRMTDQCSQDDRCRSQDGDLRTRSEEREEKNTPPDGGSLSLTSQPQNGNGNAQ